MFGVVSDSLLIVVVGSAVGLCVGAAVCFRLEYWDAMKSYKGQVRMISRLQIDQLRAETENQRLTISELTVANEFRGEANRRLDALIVQLNATIATLQADIRATGIPDRGAELGDANLGERDALDVDAS